LYWRGRTEEKERLLAVYPKSKTAYTVKADVVVTRGTYRVNYANTNFIKVFFFSCKINKSTLFNEGDTQQSSTDKPVALEFPIELEFRNVDF